MNFYPDALREAWEARCWYARTAASFLAELDHAQEHVVAHPERWPTYRHDTRSDHRSGRWQDGAQEPQAGNKKPVLPKRKLGKTGVEVTLLNHGTVGEPAGLNRLLRTAYLDI